MLEAPSAPARRRGELADLAGRLGRHARWPRPRTPPEGGGGHTPSDFSLLDLGQDDIEEFESVFGGGSR